MQAIHHETTCPAPRSAVWALLGDSATWPTWTSIGSYEPEEPGDADGLGEVRRFRTGRTTVRERIVERRTDDRLAYELLSGLPLRDYRAVIDLADAPGGGTHITWHTTFRGAWPGAGLLGRLLLGPLTRRFADGLAAAAAER